MNGFNIPSHFIGVAGDWHGDTGWALRALKTFAENGIKHVFHLGDFGFWGGHDGAAYVRKVAKCLNNNDLTLYVTLGNHENYDKISSRPVGEDGLTHYDDPRLKIFPRGFHGLIDGVDFVSLGGANSIDYKNRVEKVSWWREESISLKDFDAATAEGQKTLMFSHEMPDGVDIASLRKTWRGGWDSDEIRYSEMGRKVLREAINFIKPKVLFHGHHHVFNDVTTTFEDIFKDKFTVRTIGLAKEEMAENTIIFNVHDLSYTFLIVK